MALADAVLTDNEKKSGCVLVDLGAQTTTVAVYSKNLLRHLAVLPLGSANITKDISSLQIDEDDAERLKLIYGSAYTNPEEDTTGLNYAIDGDRTVQSDTLMNVVKARMQEIIAARLPISRHETTNTRGLRGQIARRTHTHRRRSPDEKHRRGVQEKNQLHQDKDG